MCHYWLSFLLFLYLLVGVKGKMLLTTELSKSTEEENDTAVQTAQENE